MDPHSLHEQLLHPHECFTSLREDLPVYNPDAKFWSISSYEGVHYVSSENTLFSSDESKFTTSFEEPLIKSIISLDPPRHRQLRSLLTQAFTPRTIAQMAPRITSITHELLDKVLDRDGMDVIDDLSYPLPIIVIAEMLGVPGDDRPQFKKWSDAIVSGEYDEITHENRAVITERIRKRVSSTMTEINDYFRHVIALRRQQPENDLISALLAARVDGESISEPELLGFCALLLIAGNITTTNLLGNAILCFDEHPEVMEQLRQQPALMASAIEEVLRYRSPALMIARFAATDVTIKEQLIQRGQLVVASLACANHDPAQFAAPEVFDIERNPNRHVAFGHGIHFCLGAPLARLETKIALTIMLERMNHIRLDRGQTLETVNSTFIYGAKHIPITFTSC